MFAVHAAGIVPDDPLRGLRLGDWPEPVVPDGWRLVTVRATGLNHHDLWSLRGVGIDAGQLPVVLGSEAAGVDEAGNEVIVYPVIGDPLAGGGDETLDPACRFLSVHVDGTFAERVAVPTRNLVPKPPELSFEDAACLSGAWLTAYRMLFEKAALEPGSTVLVQGAGGGVASALILMGAAVGHRMWVTTRSTAKAERALGWGAERVFAPGARLPGRVDAVMETVGTATWEHSVRCLRPGGRLVVCGATSGAAVGLDLARLFALQQSVVGTTMGTCAQLRRLAAFCVRTGVRPAVDRVLPLHAAEEGFARMARGELAGKVVFTV